VQFVGCEVVSSFSADPDKVGVSGLVAEGSKSLLQLVVSPHHLGES
jgi:hypothetical protein